MGTLIKMQPQHFRPLTDAEESSLSGNKTGSKNETGEFFDNLTASTEAEDPVTAEAVKPAERVERVDYVEPAEPVESGKVSASTVTEAVIVTETPKQKYRRRNNWRSGYLRMAVLKTIVTLDMWKSSDYGTRGKTERTAMDMLKQTCEHEKTQYFPVSKWRSVENQSIKWIRYYIRQRNI